jgi:MoaA/NifB/PqqE/SkfB family radical SAM enzyme
VSDISSFNPWKILYYREQIEQLLSGEIPPPVIMCIDPTNKCNQNCIWCFVKPYREANPVSLSKEVLIKFITEIIGKVKAITYSGGGDPLMNPATIDAISTAKHLIEQGMSTNGTGWRNYEEIDIIAQYCEYVRVSVDAAYPNTYLELHGTSGLERAIEFIKRLVSQKQNLDVNVSYMICPKNIGELVDAAKLFSDLGVDNLIIKFVYSDYLGINPGFSTREFISHNKTLIEKIINKAKEQEDNNYKILFRHPQVFDEMKLEHQSKLYKKCYISPLNQAGLAADGYIHLCSDRRGYLTLGNIITQNFFDMWGSERHKEILRSIKLEECPTRCRNTEMNQIVEEGFIKNKLWWNMI